MDSEKCKQQYKMSLEVEKGSREGSSRVLRVVLFTRMAREGFPGKVIVEKRPKGGEGAKSAPD